MSDEMLSEFIHEASEHLAAAAARLLALAKAAQVDPEDVNACFRALHTVKGCAGFLDLARIKQLSHAGEQVLDALRSGEIAGAPAIWDLLLAAVSRLEELNHALSVDGREPAGSDQDVIAQLDGVLSMPTAAAATTAVSAVEVRTGLTPTATSVDACVAGIIACSAEETEEIRRQVARIEALAEAQRWTEERRRRVAALRAAALRLAGPDGESAQVDVYSQAQALQEACQRADAGSAPAAQSPPPPAPPEPAAAEPEPAVAKPEPAVAKPQSAAAQPPAHIPLAQGSRTQDLLRDFIGESNELLAFAERTVLHRTSFNAEEINGVFRSFHTIKGMASYLQQPAIAVAAHACEERLLPVRDGQAPADQAFIQTVLGGVDQLRTLVGAVAQPPAASDAPAPEDGPPLGEVLVGMGVPRQVIEETARHLKPHENLRDKLIESGKIPRHVMEKAVQVQAAQRGDGYSRVATAKLEELVTMVGELLIAQAMVANHPDLERQPGMAAAVQRQGRIMRSLQVLALSLRMVPLRSTFQKMARAVHDTSRKLGKKVEWQTAGEDTEIDRTLAEAMADPLLHMVRNAVDHGIESADRRAAAGKAAVGVVRLEAYHGGDDVIIRLSDDGGGMDPQRLRTKAVEKGLIPADRPMTDQDCFQLIFLPGFSTAAQVTDVSGRGVGMDVVRRQVRSANGTVHIESAPGAGSVFTIRLPLTTAIMDAMLLRCGEERFLIPVASVVSMLRPADGQVGSILGAGKVLAVRGRELPVLRLGGLFAIAGHEADPQRSLLLVVENRGEDFALQVDEVLGQRQVVIKPFDHGMPRHPGLAGSAILGDGRVALILDPARLLSAAADRA